MSNATKLVCDRCKTAKHLFSGGICADCKREERQAELVKAEARARDRERLGCVGDERRAALVLEDFDRLSKAIREAAGCPRSP